MTSVYKLQFLNNTFSAKTLGSDSILPPNQIPVVFDFLSNASPWVLVSEGGVSQYEPGIAGLKNGGLTVESTLSDARSWVATPFDTVTDTFTLAPTLASTAESRADYLSKLLQLQRQANDFSTQSWELQPVFCCVREAGDAGDRYARIYDIQFALQGEPFPGGEISEYQRLTITIVRYPYWTPIPLGTNPKLYTLLARGISLENIGVSPNIARFPDNISAYNITSPIGGSVTTPTFLYQPVIGSGSTVARWISGVASGSFIDIGNTSANIAASVPENTPFSVSIWVKSLGAFASVPMRLVVLNQAGTIIATGSNFTTNERDNWVQRTITGTTPAGTTGIFLRIQKNTSVTNVTFLFAALSITLPNENNLNLLDFNNTDPNLRNAIEATASNVWTLTGTPRLNYFDVPAESVPGDAPALCTFVVQGSLSSVALENLYLARRLDALPNEALYKNSYNAQDCTRVSGAISVTFVVDATRGVQSEPEGAAANAYAINISAGAGAIGSSILMSWRLEDLPQGGKVAIFVRGAITSGSNTDLPLIVRVSAVNLTLIAQPFVLASSFAVGLFYAGVIDLSRVKNAMRSVSNSEYASEPLTLNLGFAGRSAGGAVAGRISDIVLMPYDDQFTITKANIEKMGNQFAIIDNTQYFSYDQIQASYGHAAGNLPIAGVFSGVSVPAELQGSVLNLEPNRRNRFYTMYGGDLSLNFEVRLNFIPQWRRFRSV